VFLVTDIFATGFEIHLKTHPSTSDTRKERLIIFSFHRSSKLNMGAAVTIELSKPVDASDIRESGNFMFAQREILRLRNDLGYLAQKYGMEVMPPDCSDIIFGINEQEDFERIVLEIAHIRACLQLNTQSSKRRERRGPLSVAANNYEGKEDEEGHDSASSHSDSDQEGKTCS
jgi:hypothetical protein